MGNFGRLRPSFSTKFVHQVPPAVGAGGLWWEPACPPPGSPWPGARAIIPAMITLHYHPSNASFAPHAVLRELGVPFRLQWVDRAQGAHKSAAYLALNPNGQIPVLEDGDLVLYETAAILLHLADTHPAAGLLPPLGSAARAQAYKWLVWMTNTLQAAVLLYFYPDRWVDAGQDAAAAQLKSHAQAKVMDCLRQLDAHLAGTRRDKAEGGPWMLGEAYSVLDPFAFMLCRWTRGFATGAAREHPHLGPYLQRMLQRPALQATIAAEGLPEPVI